MTFARAAPPAYDKKGNCCGGRWQTNYLIRTDAGEPFNRPINNKLTGVEGIRGWATDLQLLGLVPRNNSRRHATGRRFDLSSLIMPFQQQLSEFLNRDRRTFGLLIN